MRQTDELFSGKQTKSLLFDSKWCEKNLNNFKSHLTVYLDLNIHVDLTFHLPEEAALISFSHIGPNRKNREEKYPELICGK